MPYDDFPIDIQGEGPSLDAASILQSQHSADWAKKFKGGANNLMTRKRHQADVAENLATQQAAQEAYQRNLIQTDKIAQDFYFRSEKLDMDREFGKARLEERAQKFEHEKEMFPVTIAARKAATIAAMKRTEAMTKTDLWKEELHAQKAKDTVGFAEHVRQSGHKRGTPEFAETLADARIKFPAMDHALFQDVWKTHAGSDKDPDEALKLRQTALTVAPNATVTTKLPGGVTMTDRPVADETKALQTRYDKYVLQRARTTDKNSIKFLDAEIAEMKGKLGGFEKGLVAPAAPGVADANKAALDWVAANPNDPRAAAIRSKLGVK